MNSVLITGCAGFTAAYLVDALLATYGSDCSIYGTDLLQPADARRIAFRPCNLLDPFQVSALLNEINPSRIYHLAGSFTNDFETDYQRNVTTTKSLLDGLVAQGQSDCRMLVVGSAAEYGRPSVKNLPLDETTHLRPTTVYGLTKVFQTHLAQYYATTRGLFVVIVRPFNLIGKGISSRLFIGRLYEQIRGVKANTLEKIILGDLTDTRDYINVRDAVRAYLAALENGGAGEVYNVGSGHLVTIERLLQLFLSRWNIGRENVESTESASALSGAFGFRANISKVSTLGWTPRISIEESVESFGPDDQEVD